MTPLPPERRAKVASAADLVVFVLPLLALVGFVAWRSLEWRMRHDLPMMMYQAFAMDRFGFVPYRDFFDMNMPGTYATYLAIGKVFGYDDAGIRVADIVWMAAIGVVTFALLRGTSKVVAGLAVPLFLLIYLRMGGLFSLQREFLALLPISLGVLAALSPAPLRTRAVLTGLAFGCAATYKPPLAIGAIPVAVWIAAEARRAGGGRRGVAEVLGYGTLGLAVLPGVALGVLAALGVLGDFVDSLRYLRFYGGLTGGHKTIEGIDRLWYLTWKTANLGDNTAWVAVAVFGLLHARARATDEQRRRVDLFAALLVAYLVYPVSSGQFWGYHWLPGLYFTAIGVAHLLVPAPAAPVSGWLPQRVVLFLLAMHLSKIGPGIEGWDRLKEHRPADRRPDAIAAYLEENLEPGDTVQPFDWVKGGVCQGLLLAEARPATSFVYTFHFYHHVDQRYIQGLRDRFLRELRASKPAYVVVSKAHWPFVRGAGTTTRFPGWETWLQENYVRVAFDTEDVEMWERADRAARRGTPTVTPGTREPRAPSGSQRRPPWLPPR